MYVPVRYVYVAKMYQLALRRLLLYEDPFYTRTMQLNAEACSPMALEGYLLHNEETYGDWAPVGQVEYVCT